MLVSKDTNEKFPTICAKSAVEEIIPPNISYYRKLNFLDYSWLMAVCYCFDFFAVDCNCKQMCGGSV